MIRLELRFDGPDPSGLTGGVIYLDEADQEETLRDIRQQCEADGTNLAGVEQTDVHPDLAVLIHQHHTMVRDDQEQSWSEDQARLGEMIAARALQFGDKVDQDYWAGGRGDDGHRFRGFW